MRIWNSAFHLHFDGHHQIKRYFFVHHLLTRASTPLCKKILPLKPGLNTYVFSSMRRTSEPDGTSDAGANSEESSFVQAVPHIQPDSFNRDPLTDLEPAAPLSPFDEISEDEAVQLEAGPLLPAASFTLRDYVDHSEVLRKLVLIGVDLSRLEQRPHLATAILKLDFEKDVKDKLFFLKDVGVENHQLGSFVTKNPYILVVDIESLQKRVSYLKSKKFSKESIARMVSGAPYLLNFSVERLDNRLGFFQKELALNPQKTRDLVKRLPRLLTGSLEPVKENLKVCQIEFGFRTNEIQHMVTRVPKLLTANKKKITHIFDYLHNAMGIPHNLIVKFPQIFNGKLLRIKERHLFLKHIGRAQYDPTHPHYISLDRLVATPDTVFCNEIAKSSQQDFEHFQKTL